MHRTGLGENESCFVTGATIVNLPDFRPGSVTGPDDHAAPTIFLSSSVLVLASVIQCR
jgi:hypothetical protein